MEHFTRIHESPYSKGTVLIHTGWSLLIGKLMQRSLLKGNCSGMSLLKEHSIRSYHVLALDHSYSIVDPITSQLQAA